MKILVAEDEPEILRIYTLLLENEGHKVVATKDGMECIEVYRKAHESNSQPSELPFDLVIVDHRMPRKSGLDTAREILDISPYQKVMMVSAYDFDFGEMKARFAKTLKKPFDIDEFISSINNLSKRLEAQR